MNIRVIIVSLTSLFILNNKPIQAQTPLWPTIQKEMKPWARWWWMGNAVDEKNIGNLLENYQQIGFGGVEIAPIYGAVGYESRYLKHLSPEWMDMLHYTVKKADSLKMGVDLTLGTGWPFGGPQVDKEHAATKLIVKKYQLNANKATQKITSPDEKQTDAPLLSLTAYGPNNQVELITDKVDEAGNLNWTAKGDWELYAAFLGKTGQKVKRAAPGGEGFTLDHFSADALKQYVQPYNQAFGKQPLGVRAFYNDSYEVYGANWTPTFFDTFKKNRGYDLRYHMREFLSEDSVENIARIKSDYRETMAELLLNNFAKPWTAWGHQRQGITKYQAHGSPGNLLDLYAAADIPEAETFGSSAFPIPGLRRDSADIRNVDPDPMMLKFASSAAHVSGKNLASSETFTWLTEHFKTSWAQCKPEVEQVFLAGINHVFYHGVTYSPDDVKWPGWLFYASVNFVPANPLWNHLDGLNQYITRIQSVLQSGHADNELLVYWPIYDIWDNPKGKDIALKVHDIDRWLYPTAFYKDAMMLQENGYAFDFVSDHLLADMHVEQGKWTTEKHLLAYKALLVPKTNKMPIETLEKLVALAKEGATLIFQGLPTDVPGAFQVAAQRDKFRKLLSEINRLASLETVGMGKIIIKEGMLDALHREDLKGEALTQKGLKFIRRSHADTTYYYVVNHSDKKINDYIAFNAPGKTWYILDPLTGKTGVAATTDQAGKSAVKLQLAPGETWIVMATNARNTVTKPWEYADRPLQEIPLEGNWTLSFKDGGPTIPATQTLQKLQPWTALADNATASFAGKGVYTLTFELPKLTAKLYELHVDSVYESARVKINGQDAGLIWSLPYKLRLDKLLKPGKNTIELEVANLMANRISYMDKNQLKWNNYHGTNLVNIDYQPFDASSWKIAPSGLAGNIYIVPYN